VEQLSIVGTEKKEKKKEETQQMVNEVERERESIWESINR